MKRQKEGKHKELSLGTLLFGSRLVALRANDFAALTLDHPFFSKLALFFRRPPYGHMERIKLWLGSLDGVWPIDSDDHEQCLFKDAGRAC